jgi:hypothetical protein
MDQSNPLAKHFRQPAIYLKLPSQGSYWPTDTLTLPANGELPVYPMTTKDEIILRTPDALMNGSGVVSVIQSCIPSIQDAWLMPSVDVDACLIAIRIASYGNDMNISVTCPKCNHVDDHTIDLQQALGQLSMPDYSGTVKDTDLTIKFKPQNYFAVNRTNSISYEEQRILNVLNSSDMTVDQKDQNLKEITDKLIDLNTDNLAASTEWILMSDGTRVSDTAYIKEFYANTSAALIGKIRAHLSEMAVNAGLKPFHTNCSECSTEFDTEITFDYANFFGSGS